jgi:hypothetical protein
MALAVAALDAWLYSSLHGYGQQCFFAFGAGGGWSSHTMPGMGGFRRQTGWLALMLRNRYATGTDMLKVRTESVPSYAREGTQIPLVAVYAIDSPHALSIFILNRALGGNHDGTDFGSGSIKASIRLPGKTYRSLTRYALTAPGDRPADPRASNSSAENIVISETPIDPKRVSGGLLEIGPATGGTAGGIPQGCVYLYVLGK